MSHVGVYLLNTARIHAYSTCVSVLYVPMYYSCGLRSGSGPCPSVHTGAAQPTSLIDPSGFLIANKCNYPALRIHGDVARVGSNAVEGPAHAR